MTTYIDDIKIRFDEQVSSPATPDAGRWLLFAKSDGIHVKDDAGNDTLLGSGGGFTSFDVAGDSGSNQTITDGDTLSILGGAGIATTMTATDILTIDNVWDYEKILEVTDSFDVTLSSVTKWSSAVTSIIIEFGLRSTAAATTDNVLIFFNNDTTVGDYYTQLNGAINGSAGAGAQVAIPLIMRGTAASSTVGSFGMGTLVIPAPNSTVYLKQAKVSTAAYQTTNTLETGNGAITWVTGGTAAITRIQIRTDNYPTDQFVANSFIRMKFIK